MPLSRKCARPDCLIRLEPWLARLRTLRAMLLLCLACAVVALIPFKSWRGWLGGKAGAGSDPVRARRHAAQIERAARRMPVRVKCLPQAMALSWQLRQRGTAHRIVFAVRPPGHRKTDDTLHAWIECQDRIVLGELPGPWMPVFELPER